MKTINELLWVLVITIIGLCVGFGIFLYNHEKERKKNLLKAISNMDSSGQPDQSVHDVTTASRTTSTATTISKKDI